MKKYFPIMTAAVFLAASPMLQAKTFSLTIQNNTKSILEAFYASPTGEDDWENDLLEDNAVRAGGSYTVRFKDDRDVCRYDLRFEFRGSKYEPLEDTQNLCQIKEYELTD